jgi:phospholipid/cholesterol/gamma-HCH transport system permease protein
MFSFLRRPKPPECAAEILPADSERVVVRLTGAWAARSGVPDASPLDGVLKKNPAVRTLLFDAAGVTRYDSALPAYLLRCKEIAEENSATIDIATLPEGVRRLLSLALARPVREEADHSETVITFLHRVGEWGLQSAGSWHKATDFIGHTVLACFALLRGKARFRRSDLMYFIQTCGVDALPIVTLISFLTGLIMAYVGSVQLKQFGATMYVANLVGLAMVREMGVLMTGIILCGRTGTAFAAQLGSMNASEEISAFRVLGINPVEYLVLPRMLALTLMMPLLTLYADFVGMIGGLAVVSSMDVTVEQYFIQLVKAISMTNFCSGLIKSVFFGALIAWAGCFRGMTSGRSSLDVGNAATGAAVLGITLIIVADALFAVIFNVIGYF